MRIANVQFSLCISEVCSELLFFFCFFFFCFFFFLFLFFSIHQYVLQYIVERQWSLGWFLHAVSFQNHKMRQRPKIYLQTCASSKSGRIRARWSESSLGAFWMAEKEKFLHVNAQADYSLFGAHVRWYVFWHYDSYASCQIFTSVCLCVCVRTCVYVLLMILIRKKKRSVWNKCDDKHVTAKWAGMLFR